MKRTAAVLCVILTIAMVMCSCVYAADLQITGITPKDGAKGLQPQNMAIKIDFSENVTSDEAMAANGDKFVIKAADGTVIPYSITCNPKKYPNQILVLADQDLAADSEYTFEIKSGVVSSEGSTLAAGMTTGFKTRNTKTDNLISTIMMFGLMGVMFFMTSKANKKAQEEADPLTAQRMAVNKLNPYKLAKERGISVDEANAIIAKEKAKLQKQIDKLEEEQRKKDEEKKAEMEAYEAEFLAQMEAERHANNYHVKGPKSLAAAGYKIPRSVIKANKAKREAAAKAEKAKNNKKK